MWANSTDLFAQLCSKVSNKMYFEQLMIKQQQYFDIQPYKIDKLYSEPAKQLYKQISFKYQVTKQLLPNPNIWHQNQRKIFIWFIVCYFHQIGAQDPLQATIDWQTFSSIFFSKSSYFLKFQFLNIIKLKKRIIWTLEEDALLAKATLDQGIGKWNQISKALFFNSSRSIFKSPKHCRQRWLNHLDTNKNKGKWTDEEDYKILLYVREYGKKWSKIVKVLNHTRTQHMIKNRFNSLLTKNRKNKKQKQLETVNKVIKALEKMLNGSITVKQDQNQCQNLGRTTLIELQSNEQSQQDEMRELNEQCEEKMIVQNQGRILRKGIESKSSFQISTFETSTLFNSVSYLSENMSAKQQDRKDSINCFSNFFFLKGASKFVRIDRQKERQSNLREVDEKMMWLNNREGVVHKLKPVYVIQLNIN